LLFVELVFVFEELAPEVAELLFESAFVGGVNRPVEGVYKTDVVVAFEPAEDDPDDEKEEDAPGPDVPEDALDWIYR
jgi:hypothetical protein